MTQSLLTVCIVAAFLSECLAQAQPYSPQPSDTFPTGAIIGIVVAAIVVFSLALLFTLVRCGLIACLGIQAAQPLSDMDGRPWNPQWQAQVRQSRAHQHNLMTQNQMNAQAMNNSAFAANQAAVASSAPPTM
ncbi:hypothetical protein CALCODRAFT_193196 [Calocera cornea HHB12733]|uniref:Membrane-associated protein n=1 Tax=Calocera cornea HHB12733 TaxID=1353952 RepID=A0A165C7E6_9BASI|nr:hypothetical protein CALCODRAFT_193196 [Calocera cornea HHB12733]